MGLINSSTLLNRSLESQFFVSMLLKLSKSWHSLFIGWIIVVHFLMYKEMRQSGLSLIWFFPCESSLNSINQEGIGYPEKKTFAIYTAQKMKFSIKDFFSKCDQIRRKPRIWSHWLKKSLMKNFIFCEVLNWRVTVFC